MGKKSRAASARTNAAKIAEIRARSRWFGFTSLKRGEAKIAFGVGLSFIVVSVIVYGQLAMTAVTDRLRYIQLSYEMHTSADEFGPRTFSAVAASSGPFVVLFLVGCLLVALADISRRRPRPVSVGALLGVSAVFLLAFLAVCPLQFVTGVLPGDPHFDGVRVTLTPPAIVFALGALAPLGYLLVRRIRSGSVPRM
ncbi:hypothetical protein F1C58_16195 (plasmid) [Glaciihabitans sp. INWT7]|uniref:hypothetical protein n=1 Tax=Glaciihabitans sp. INWT7 TaxID=2596912 RepID=UPI0016263AA0|nr:hypothetical protein [Glaciihabitans sp. INWT7]QNE48600.1 hypothetical protein F1C58_16195 [Glaciihabitans sp. INWT7]